MLLSLNYYLKYQKVAFIPVARILFKLVIELPAAKEVSVVLEDIFNAGISLMLVAPNMLVKLTTRDVSINGTLFSEKQELKQLLKSVTLDELKPPTSDNTKQFANIELKDVASGVFKYGTDLNELHPENRPTKPVHLVKLNIGIVTSDAHALNMFATVVASPKS